ncbi:hypothetical protein SDC9_161574 [bioreactor metagenome]|uniref:Uncharacterized protein n=1 Tax=bioreactor metagenome TaxID=1076179 RepID=A0A645FIL9_9ZZZZ
MSGQCSKNKGLGRDFIIVCKGIQYPAFKGEGQQPGKEQGKDDDG